MLRAEIVAADEVTVASPLPQLIATDLAPLGEKRAHSSGDLRRTALGLRDDVGHRDLQELCD